MGADIGISSFTLDPLTPSTLYVVAPGVSALYKSTDGGESWNSVDPGSFPNLLAIDPTNPSTLYAMRFRTGLSKSTDGGASWTATGFNKDVAALAIDPRNSQILYASTSVPARSPAGIFKSTDGGRNWNQLNTTMLFAPSLVLNPANPSVIYAGTFLGGVFKSTDAGANWSESNSGLRVLGIQTLVGDPTDPAIVYAGGDEGLFKSINSGASWNQQAAFQVTLFTSGILPPVSRASVHSLLIDYTNPNILYAETHRTGGCFTGDGLLFKSTDGGVNWSDSISPNESGCLADALMAMDPTDPNTLYLRFGAVYEGGDLTLYRSTDGGARWTFAGVGADEGYRTLNALVIDPTTPSTLYAATSGGVFQTADGGGKWSVTGLAKVNVNLVAIDPLQPNVLYAGTFRGLFKSTDSGASWAPIGDGLGDLLDARPTLIPWDSALVVDPDHTDVLYLGTSGYGVLKSVDGGATWEPNNDGLTNVDVRALAIVRGDSTTVYAATPGGVFKILQPDKTTTQSVPPDPICSLNSRPVASPPVRPNYPTNPTTRTMAHRPAPIPRP